MKIIKQDYKKKLDESTLKSTGGLRRSLSSSNLSGSTAGSMEVSFGGVQIKGSNPDGSIPILFYSSTDGTSYDTQTGRLLGKRQHNPITIRKEVDSTSPFFYQALVAGSKGKVVITLYGLEQGQRGPRQTTSLDSTFVTNIDQALANTFVPSSNGTSNPLEEISFVYQKITWTNISSGVSASDTW